MLGLLGTRNREVAKNRRRNRRRVGIAVVGSQVAEK